MQIRTLFQPAAGQSGAEIQEALRKMAGPTSTATLVSAWTKASGVVRLQEAISQFRDKGGRVTAATGIDLGGTSREGVELLLETCDEVLIVHDLDRSFHPKHYIVRGDDQAIAIVGSGNLTKSGLYTNYEVFAILEFDFRRSPTDGSALDQLISAVDDLIRNDETSRVVNQELIRDLVASGGLPPEVSSPAYDENGSAQPLPMFGRRRNLPGAPPVRRSIALSPVGPPHAGESFAKVLTRNDVGATGGHQAGIVIPKNRIGLFPRLDEETMNPNVVINVTDERGDRWQWKFIHYNNKVVDFGTRDEYRVTKMTRYLRERDAEPGDAVTFQRIGRNAYRVSFRHRR